MTASSFAHTRLSLLSSWLNVIFVYHINQYVIARIYLLHSRVLLLLL
jgi:hypothetical protein